LGRPVCSGILLFSDGGKLLRDLIDYDTAIAELKQKQDKLGEASGKG
jgi:hypothetical protein